MRGDALELPQKGPWGPQTRDGVVVGLGPGGWDCSGTYVLTYKSYLMGPASLLGAIGKVKEIAFHSFM